MQRRTPIATAVVVLLTPWGPLIPLWGDGRTDDALALQQRIDRGLPIAPGDYAVAGPVVMRDRLYGWA